jgi:hypothetical protein
MKTTEAYKTELARAEAKWAVLYKRMLASGMKLRDIDRDIRRLKKAVRKSRAYQRNVSNGQSFATPQ